MLIPLLVIGVLFLITWFVIGISTTPTPVERGHDSHHHCPYPFVDPYHTCAYSKLQGRMDSELSYIRAEQRRLAQKVDYTTCIHEMPKAKSPEEVFKELMRDEPPKEIIIKDAKYKLQK